MALKPPWEDVANATRMCCIKLQAISSREDLWTVCDGKHRLEAKTFLPGGHYLSVDAVLCNANLLIRLSLLSEQRLRGVPNITNGSHIRLEKTG